MKSKKDKSCMCQHECSARCYSMRTGHDIKGLAVKCNCPCHSDDGEGIERRILGFILNNEPVTAQVARDQLEPKMPMPTFQKHIVNMHIRGAIEKLPERNKGKQTLWRIPRPDDKSVFHEELL